MSLHVWFRLYLLFLICSYVDSERVASSLFPENGSFVKLREGCFALLIPSKFKISYRTCADHKCLLHILVVHLQHQQFEVYKN